MTVTQRVAMRDRYAWAAGIVFVAFLLGESVVAVGVPANQNDSSGKIATALQDHRTRLIAIACLSVVYAVAFVVYLWRFHRLLRGEDEGARSPHSLVLVGGIVFVTLHAVSDIGITGLLGGKLATYAAQHDPGLSYALYLLTYALDSVGDVFGAMFALAGGWLLLRSGLAQRWLAWLLILVGPFFILQAFGLGGVIGTFGLVLDLIGFLLLLVFVLVSSIVFLRRRIDVAHEPPVA